MASLAGCSGGDGGDGGGDGGDGGGSDDTPEPTPTPTPEPAQLDIGGVSTTPLSSPVNEVVTKEIPENYNIETSLQFFENQSLVSQAMAARQINFGVSSGTGGAASLVNAGKPTKFVFPHLTTSDYVLVGQPHIESLQDIVDKDAVIGMGSLTGLDSMQVVGLLIQEGIVDSVDELTFQQVGFSSARQTAMLKENPQIDVSPQHFGQWIEMKEAKPDLNLLAEFGNAFENYILEGSYAFEETIEENRDTLAKFVAEEVKMHQRVTDDFDFFVKLTRRYTAGGGPDRDVLKQLHDFVMKDVGALPTSIDEYNEEGRELMSSVVHQVGIADEPMDPDNLFDTSVAERARDFL